MKGIDLIDALNDVNQAHIEQTYEPYGYHIRIAAKRNWIISLTSVVAGLFIFAAAIFIPSILSGQTQETEAPETVYATDRDNTEPLLTEPIVIPDTSPDTSPETEPGTEPETEPETTPETEPYSDPNAGLRTGEQFIPWDNLISLGYIKVENGVVMSARQYRDGIPEKQMSGTLWVQAGITEIADGTFKNDKLETVVLPESMTTIGDYAFYGCNIQSLTLKKNIKAIGQYAFAHNKLNKIYNDGVISLEKIGAYAFSDNHLLREFSYDLSKINIGENAFQNTAIKLPHNTESSEEDGLHIVSNEGNLKFNQLQLPTKIIQLYQLQDDIYLCVGYELQPSDTDTRTMNLHFFAINAASGVILSEYQMPGMEQCHYFFRYGNNVLCLMNGWEQTSTLGNKIIEIQFNNGKLTAMVSKEALQKEELYVVYSPDGKYRASSIVTSLGSGLDEEGCIKIVYPDGTSELIHPDKLEEGTMHYCPIKFLDNYRLLYEMGVWNEGAGLGIFDFRTGKRTEYSKRFWGVIGEEIYFTKVCDNYYTIDEYNPPCELWVLKPDGEEKLIAAFDPELAKDGVLLLPPNFPYLANSFMFNPNRCWYMWDATAGNPVRYIVYSWDMKTMIAEYYTTGSNSKKSLI